MDSTSENSQAQDNHPADGGKELTGHAGDHQDRQERSNRRQDAKRGGNGDFHHTFNDIIGGVSFRPNIGVGALTNDDRVIHHDTQHQDESEQAQHVNA